MSASLTLSWLGAPMRAINQLATETLQAMLHQASATLRPYILRELAERQGKAKALGAVVIERGGVRRVAA